MATGNISNRLDAVAESSDDKVGKNVKALRISVQTVLLPAHAGAGLPPPTIIPLLLYYRASRLYPGRKVAGSLLGRWYRVERGMLEGQTQASSPCTVHRGGLRPGSGGERRVQYYGG